MSKAIRPYRPADLDALYEICLRTGDAGEDASHLYDDPMLLGHLYAAPYATLEPEFAFVLEDEGGVCGYILGALDTKAFRRKMIDHWLPTLRSGVPKPDGDRERWGPADHLYHQIHFPREDHSKWLERYPSHLHIDILPRGQGQGHGRALMERLLSRLEEADSPGVHLGVDRRNERAQGFYRKLGFSRLDDESNGGVRMVRQLQRS